MDLSLIPIQDLYDEILKRFDHIVIVGLKQKPNEKNISRRWKGSHHICMGLCQDVSYLVGKDWLDNQEEIGTEDL